MRVSNAHHRSGRRLVASAAVLILCLCNGCGNPGYVLDTEQMAAKLREVSEKEDVDQWVAAQIENHLMMVTNRPASMRLAGVPTWMKSVNSFTDYVIEYEANPQNDHVSFYIWCGRGGWGVLLGGKKFEPDTNRLSDSLFYVVKSSPGCYA
jgi:hypothetical protein